MLKNINTYYKKLKKNEEELIREDVVNYKETGGFSAKKKVY
nr:hypothetical protein [Mycoplasmopsis bovis]